MAAKSAFTDEFRRGKTKDDCLSLYSSFRFVNGIYDTINNEQLCSQVADRILKNNSLHAAVNQRGTVYKTVKEYCDRIKKGKLPGGEPEIRALSMISRILIREVCLMKTEQGKPRVTVLNFGEESELFKECVYILYNEETDHYEPLYMVNKEKPEDKKTIFDRNDTKVIEILEEFIHKELHDDGFIQLDCYIPSYEAELPTTTNDANEDDQTVESIRPTATEKLVKKRKLPDHANLQFAQTVDKEPSLPMDTNNPAKVPKLDMYTTVIIDENSSESMTFEGFFQMNTLSNDPTIEELPATPIAVVEESRMMDFITAPDRITANVPIITNHEQLITGMRFKVEPAERFRGRTNGDFKPKPKKTRKSEASSPRPPRPPRPPRYFADRNNKRPLSLLIPNNYLEPDVFPIRIMIDLVTREINGYTYRHPYFKFQTPSTDPQAANINPIYKDINSVAELQLYTEELQQLKLPLVVVMHTNPELMACEQPLEVFPVPENSQNQTAITETFNTHKELKKAYNLHAVRFAVTVWKQHPGQVEYERIENKTYISEVSRESRHYKVPKKLCK